mgnify:CR=1 FL=1
MVKKVDKVPENLYFAVIGDIIRSKKIPNRSKTQEKLAETLACVNEKYRDCLASKFMITLGDEFQGLLKTGGPAVELITGIEMKLYPVRLRFGVGVGEIVTAIDPELPLGADGPAYHNAREMLTRLKSLEKKSKSPDRDCMVASGGLLNDELVNTVFSLCAAIRKKWTRLQWETVADCIELGDNQLMLARKYKIGQPSVQKRLSGAEYYAYKNALSAVSREFSRAVPDARA